MKKVLSLVIIVSLVFITGCNKSKKEDDFCKGCYFGKSDTHIGQPLPSDYSKDYSNLGNYFLAHTVEDGVVKESYACGIEDGKKFCLKSKPQTGGDTEYKKTFEENKKIIEEIFTDVEDKRNTEYKNIVGKGKDVQAEITTYYSVKVSMCTVNDGYGFCLK